MKALLFKIIIPLTIISFTIFTKWWSALPIDASETLFFGFPFVYIGRGWVTSLSHQVFVLELLADITIYFIFWFVLVFCFNNYWFTISINKFLTVALWILSFCCIAFGTILFSNKDNVYYAKRLYEMEIITSGYRMIWQDNPKD